MVQKTILTFSAVTYASIVILIIFGSNLALTSVDQMWCFSFPPNLNCACKEPGKINKCKNSTLCSTHCYWFVERHTRRHCYLYLSRVLPSDLFRANVHNVPSSLDHMPGDVFTTGGHQQWWFTVAYCISLLQMIDCRPTAHTCIAP